MRKRRHHPLHIERTDGGAFRHCLAALRLLLAPERLEPCVGDARQLLVERCKNVVGDVEVGAAGQGGAGFDHHVGAAALHDRLVDRAELAR